MCASFFTSPATTPTFARIFKSLSDPLLAAVVLGGTAGAQLPSKQVKQANYQSQWRWSDCLEAEPESDV